MSALLFGQTKAWALEANAGDIQQRHRNSMMHITYLGHAGFLAETDDAIVVMDPWLPPTGAFDASWFQLPRNHHLASFVYEKLRDPHRSILLSFTHTHKNHPLSTFLTSSP